MPSRRRLILLAVAALGSLFAGCTNPNLVRVKPWERATLTTYAMRPDRDPLHTTMMEHTYLGAALRRDLNVRRPGSGRGVKPLLQPTKRMHASGYRTQWE